MIAEPKPARNPIKVILDSNALFVPLQFKIDIFEELKSLLPNNFEPIMLSPILHELEKLADKGSPAMRKKASFALKLAEKCRVAELDESPTSPPDDTIIKTASNWKCVVFTNDRQLRRRLRNINVPVIYVRQKSRLEIDGRI
jgi:rRNA-processing protein FCF1